MCIFVVKVLRIFVDYQWRTYPTPTCTWSASPWHPAGSGPVLCTTSSPTLGCPSPCPGPTVTGGESMPIQVTLQQLLLRCREVVAKKYGKLCFKFCPSLTVTGGESMRTQVTLQQLLFRCGKVAAKE